MNARWLWAAFGTGTLFVGLGCATHERPIRSEKLSMNVSAKELTIAAHVTVRDAPSVKERVQVKVIVRNNSRVRVWLNSRLALNAYRVPAFVEVWFEIRDEEMTRYDFVHCRVNPGFATRTDYVIVVPGKEISSVKTLKCFPLLAGRTYTLVAHYRDGTKVPPEAPAGSAPFLGELVSDPVTFTVP